MMAAVNNRIYDLQSVLKTTEDHSVTQLTEVAQEIDVWQTKVGINSVALPHPLPLSPLTLLLN